MAPRRARGERGPHVSYALELNPSRRGINADELARAPLLSGSPLPYLAPHFQWDVFVSYSHGDPRGAGTSPLKRWSRGLIEALTEDILSLSTEFDELEIWYDEQIDRSAELTAELRKTVKAAGMLLILMSPRYLKSPWCQDEREWFKAEVQERALDLSRVFVVRVVSTEEDKWPDFLRDERGYPVIGFRFHPTPERPHDIVEPFGWPDLVQRSEPFRKELSRLRTALTRRLRELKKARDEAQARADTSMRPDSASNEALVYLHVRPDDGALRDQVASTLNQRGCAIITPIPFDRAGTLKTWSDERTSRIQRAKNCDVLGLIRPANDGTFNGELLDIAVAEREQIMAERGAPLPCAVFDGLGRHLPSFATRFGLRAFDLRTPEWADMFSAWLRGARGHGVRAAS